MKLQFQRVLDTAEALLAPNDLNVNWPCSKYFLLLDIKRVARGLRDFVRRGCDMGFSAVTGKDKGHTVKCVCVCVCVSCSSCVASCHQILYDTTN